jgi:DNA-binding beta-propeller fold protein YncE
MFLRTLYPRKFSPAMALPLIIFLAGAASTQQGWYPHEGGLLKYSVNIKFGEEPVDTLPDGWKLGRVSAVATDSDSNVYIVQRGKKADPVIVFDRKGKFLRSWGRGLLQVPHGIRVDREDNVFITDLGTQQVYKFTKEGKLLLTLGTKGVAGAGENSFNQPTDIGFAKNGDFYVGDGYGNSRVVKFSKEGKFLMSWGKAGRGPGEFQVPHAVQVDSKGWVYVSDRENNRIQIFDANGKFIKQWTHLGATQGMVILANDDMWILTHRNAVENLTYDTLAGRIMHIDIKTGKILGSMETPGHWLDVSKFGELYVGSLTGNVFYFYPRWQPWGIGSLDPPRVPDPNRGR